MKIDCRNLECPQPVLETKKALESLPDDSTLDVLVNSVASKENVIRYASNCGYSSSFEESEDGVKITIIKGFECTISPKSEFLNKVLFLKDDKIGENELGNMLMAGFLQNLLEQESLPKEIICVNKAIYLTTKNKKCVEILKQLEEKGVEIYSCGVCLDFYEVTNELKVGKIGNSFSVVQSLLESKDVISL
ncbi:MAG: sulfurtransferase-like selenium metabolism protein YedF [Sulfurospirillaceae bacterium]|jgi:selenium metabolism protein YedF|nr:sulfurtransferase-like selenium metabolism protein YedF [Sulfurospirillaceae bacterium]MCK9546324.1 sulfurtransferase-like selenium metabolism protein YedF [Sulfurospirillaceae bacterium]MDY0237953.1 sulfurtransferase-like selenium metabolism protein YedF [Campylobacterales bacterium]NLM99224.1 sulfurtransferase-like selenium metabolism protein YedF [Campylobacteraceae bacterium]